MTGKVLGLRWWENTELRTERSPNQTTQHEKRDWRNNTRLLSVNILGGRNTEQIYMLSTILQIRYQVNVYYIYNGKDVSIL